MKIALVGYGKMGVAIEELATKAGHSISYKIDLDNQAQLAELNNSNTNVVIEFSNPTIAVENIKICLSKNIPIVCGTTGWLNQWEEVEQACSESDGSFFYASNYSIGVNLFFKLNEFAAKLLADKNYEISLEEIHHTEKKDSPSGTAITLAKPIIDALNMDGWVNQTSNNTSELGIISKRKPNVPGTHTVTYSSKIDEISLSHVAHSRKGFAKGALAVAEWVYNTKAKGMLSMNDFLTI